MEPFRLGVTICEKEFPFVYNEEFELMDRGTPQFFVNGEVRFPPGREVDGTYRTKFGGASHNATIYGKYDENFRKAMQRLTGKRCPENPGEHERLQALQAEWFARNEDVIALLRSMPDTLRGILLAKVKQLSTMVTLTRSEYFVYKLLRRSLRIIG